MAYGPFPQRNGRRLNAAVHAHDGNNYNDPAGPNETQIFRQFLFQWMLGSR